MHQLGLQKDEIGQDELDYNNAVEESSLIHEHSLKSSDQGHVNPLITPTTLDIDKDILRSSFVPSPLLYKWNMIVFVILLQWV